VTAFLAKDPNKQNIHEKIAGDYIITIEGISEFKILPKSGKNAKILTNDGRVTFGNGVKSNKSIDFEFIYCGIHFYCSHKYTKDSGGAQDNSYNDLCNFLTSTRRVVDKKVYFLAIADGNYYANKLEIMNIEFVGSRCRAVSTENLKEFLESTFPKIK
jgi:hypothetical protein